ncbi:MAG: HAMP domain-containing sensor histidine kinase [Bacteroidales bacterium]|nr:HAMP domain-containing histidine kinase [Bacteroidales bacterium]
MQIRKKLTLQFIIIVALILALSLLAIYFFSADYRRDDFYNRLLNKGTNSAKLLIEVEEIDAGLLRRIDQDNPMSLPKEIIAIYNYKNELLYGSDNDELLHIHQELLDRIRLEQEIRYRQGNHEILGFLYADKFDRFVVIIGAVDIYGLKKLHNLQTVIFLVFAISILVVFVSGSIYAAKALKPISRVVEQVNNITITSLNLKVDEGNGKDEIALLAATFNKMLSRLEAAFKIQKNFIANASHELRTPLTAITGQLEVALIKQRTPAAYQEILLSVLDDIKRLNHLANRLLLLAQTGAENPEANFNPLHVDDVVWQARADIIKTNPNYKINVTLHETFEDNRQLTIAGNAHLIKTAVSNLMDNACKYSADHQCLVNISPAQNHITLEFSDNGIGIAPQDIPTIFEPFRRGRNAAHIHGHGIGLSLVERVVKLHGGTITLYSAINQGSTFTITLPVAQF